MKSFSTILQALVHHATEKPNNIVFTWVDIKCKEQRNMTFKQLEDESNAVAARLLKLGCKKGDRVMVAYPFGLEFLAGMFGAMKIGVIPCSIYPPNPSQLKTDMPKFRGFVEDAGAKYALTSNTFATAMTAASILYKTGVKWIGTDKLPIKKSNPNKPKAYEKFLGHPEDICFIQYTSGSTGRPKGVMINHRNLVENCMAIGNMSNVDPSTVAALWVPQYHDMGLVAGFMSSLYSGIHLVMASPLDFVVNPLLWTDMVEKYQANLTCAPNFAYALLLKRLEQANRKADWSCVKRAMFGGEPAQSHVVEAVVKTLSIKPEHVYNIYGLAESVVFLTGGSAFPDSEGLVSCGVVDSPTLKLRIVEEGEDVEDGAVGSIWAQSPCVAAGYYGQPELTTSTFANDLLNYEGTWLNTGDLGKIVGGQLYVTGRVKDVIIINGKNYYPTDVELSTDDLFGDVIRPGRTTAFQHGDDSVGITVEGRKGFDKSANEDLAVQIANHVSQAHGLPVSEVVILKLGVTPKTTSGKLKRSEIRQTTITGDWKESSILLHFRRQKPRSALERNQRSSFLERSFSLKGVASREFYLNEETEHEIMRRSIRLPAGSLDSTFEEQLHVAVVGAGAAGLVTALRLAQRNIKVTLLEQNERIGGHARHVEVFGHERNPAFGVFLADEYPNLINLARELGVEPIRLGPSNQTRGIISMTDQSIPTVSESEISRFVAEMQRIHNAGTGQNETIGHFFHHNGYDHQFIVYFYVGKIVSFFAGQSIQDYLNIPLEIVAWFVTAFSISNKDVLRLSNKRYMDAFQLELKRLGVEVCTSVNPKILRRDDSGIAISTGTCVDEVVLNVDKVVLAVPPTAAVHVLGDSMSPEENVLADFDCPLETVVLHTDSKWVDIESPGHIMFANIPECSSLPDASDTIPITTSCSSDSDGCTPIYVTHAYDTHEDLEFNSPVEKMSFTHTKITCKAFHLRKSLLQHQGNHSTYYAGGWTRGTMLHEDALVSGIVAANAVLTEFGMVPHPVSERKHPIPSSRLSERAVTASGHPGIQDAMQEPTADDFSKRYANTVVSVFGSEVDLSKTWTENGMTSIKSAELRNKVEEELRAILPANFEQLYPTPQSLLVFLEASETKSFPKQDRDDHPDFTWKSSRSRLNKLELGILQTLASVAIFLLIVASVVPSYLLVSWVMDQCGSNKYGECHGPTFWILLPLSFPLYILSLSVAVVICKYAIVGAYQHGQLDLLSWGYLRWWFMDRLVEVWESLVGQFVVETRHIWIFYWLLGADLAWSAKVEAYIREFDLVKVGSNATIGHSLKCRKFSMSSDGSPKLTFRPLVIGKSSSISGMVSPGAKIGDCSKVVKLSVVEDGAQVPDGVLARGNPAFHAGLFEVSDAESWKTFILDGFKIVWTTVEAYHFFSLSYVVHFALNEILPSWRYGGILHWILLFPFTSFLALLTSIALKWLLIGKRDPSDEYEGSLWREATNWACDFHFRTACWSFIPFFGQSRIWNIILFLHGLDVDMSSALSGPYFYFLPSKVDFVKIRNSFLASMTLDFNKTADSKIEIINSSIGFGVNLHAGVKIMQSSIPPRSDVSDSIFDLNQIRAKKAAILTEEVGLQLMNVVFFASIIPSYEIGLAATTSSSAGIAAFGLAVAVLVLFFVWILSARIVEGVLLNLPHQAQQDLFGVYLNHVWYFRVGNILEMLLYGTPMFAYYARFMGAEVDGDLWYFGFAIYEYGKMHFQGNTIVDSSSLNCHYMDQSGITMDDTYVSGIIHPGCFAVAGSVITGEDNGPWKVFLSSVGGKESSPNEISLVPGSNDTSGDLSVSASVDGNGPLQSLFPLLSKDTSFKATCALKLGMPAPSFELPNSQGEGTTSLQGLVESGRWTVLYFYPGAFTSGCTLQAHYFQRDIDQYRHLNAQIVGVSVDSVEKNKAFCTAQSLDFFMLSDQEGCVSQAYGSAVSIPRYATISNRQTYLIDPQGRLRWIFLDFESRIASHSKEVLSKLQELKSTDSIC
ncbi:D-alanine--D-alanyl carrier protein ligase [Seminavis robusta]|uniref:D-alanine--D-alanyl carrier protein ligase n=1 Tax=Seminavis robusta TaxID=568900 RepID=A0A9N8DFM2_9STRA|nr:D-alanine--D-alanyl carrier protein ligase [Seminavis robusta]|eukprot:Sro96_g049480.1 D-alanine--D-alanyl carrier protein ligase (2004) ;mRNA; f:17875-24067